MLSRRILDAREKRRLVVGVLGRLALYKKKREGKFRHGAVLMQEFDRKMLWRMRRVSAEDRE
jgi:hypothetical protein